MVHWQIGPTEYHAPVWQIDLIRVALASITVFSPQNDGRSRLVRDSCGAQIMACCPRIGHFLFLLIKRPLQARLLRW